MIELIDSGLNSLFLLESPWFDLGFKSRKLLNSGIRKFYLQ